MLFVVVDGVPSIGQWVTVGSGKVEEQPTAEAADLPESSGFKVRETKDSSVPGDAAGKDKDDKSSAFVPGLTTATALLVGTFGLCLLA